MSAPIPLNKLALYFQRTLASLRARATTWSLPTSVNAQRVLSAAFNVLGICVWLLVLTQTVVEAVRIVERPFDGPAMNGAFQLFNPLRRIADGQRPGADFQFFHGLGIPLLHFPIFGFAGRDLFASELSRYCVSGILFLVTGLLLLRALRLSWGMAALLAASMAWAAAPLDLGEISTPGNSLLGVRSSLPLLFAATMLWLKRKSTRQFEIALSAGLAITLLSATEQGLAALLAMSVVLIVTPFACGPLRARIWTAGRVVLGALLGYVLLLFLVAGFRFYEPLLYALRDVPGDQFWYFGSPPNPFITELKQLLAQPVLMFRWRIALCLLPLAIWMAYRAPLLAGREAAVITFLLVYGLLTTASYLGMSIVQYTEPLFRIEILIIMYLLVRAAPGLMVGEWESAPARRLGLLVGVLLAGSLFAEGSRSSRVLFWESQEKPTVGQQVAGINLGSGWSYSQNLARSAIDGALKEQSTTAKVQKDRLLWSTYAGLLEADYGVFHPAEDYIIHALGPKRRKGYDETFRRVKPLFVTTIRRHYSRYEEWLQHEHWPFYEQVALNYKPIAVTGHSILWQELPGATWQNPAAWEGTLEPKAGEDKVRLPAIDKDEDSILVVELSYEVRNNARWIPVLGGLPRYLVHLENTLENSPVSLPPKESKWTFAVHRRPRLDPYLRFQGLSPVGKPKVIVRALRYRTLRAPALSKQALLDRLPRGRVSQ